MRWSTGEEIPPLSDDILFSGTQFKAHTSGFMTLDLSSAYDMELLEQPLTDDHYYLVLTNNHFAFDQDFFTYETDAVQNPQDYTFIRGRLMAFEQMEEYKIYEDERYVCYNVSSLFYSDLRQYVESMVSQRSDVYFDEQVWERVQNIYTYYNENIGSLLCYRDSANVSRMPDRSASEEKAPDIPVSEPSAQQEQIPPVRIGVTEQCYDNPSNPVSGQDYQVGEPNYE